MSILKKSFFWVAGITLSLILIVFISYQYQERQTKKTIEKIDEISLSKKLVKLGRDEGKVLTSQWTKFAVTKWFNAEVNNRKINNLSTEDIETLTNALKIKLIEISKN